MDTVNDLEVSRHSCGGLNIDLCILCQQCFIFIYFLSKLSGVGLWMSNSTEQSIDSCFQRVLTRTLTMGTMHKIFIHLKYIFPDSLLSLLKRYFLYLVIILTQNLLSGKRK